MNDTSNSGWFWLCVGVAFLVGLFVMSGGGSSAPAGGATTTTTTSTTSTSNVQVNILSAVNNGRIASDDTTTTQATVSGDHSQVIFDQQGNSQCWNGTEYVYYTPPCPEVKP